LPITKNKPFIVESGGLQIKALGTSFNVKAYTERYNPVSNPYRRGSCYYGQVT